VESFWARVVLPVQDSPETMIKSGFMVVDYLAGEKGGGVGNWGKE